MRENWRPETGNRKPESCGNSRRQATGGGGSAFAFATANGYGVTRRMKDEGGAGDWKPEPEAEWPEIA
jgi:hypothetical protein